MQNFDVVVIGAGAAGMMCAIEAGRRGRSVLVIDHARAPGEKIRISGGGRCNFTNIHASPKNFISGNPSFCISALSRYTQADFIALVESHRIAYHEKTLGQLFCDGSSRQIVDMLVTGMKDNGAELRLSTSVERIEKTPEGFALTLSNGAAQCSSLVVACGGKSIPKMGATGFGYDIARQFGLRLTETRPALVPLTLEPNLLARLAPLAGVAVDAVATCGRHGIRRSDAVHPSRPVAAPRSCRSRPIGARARRSGSTCCPGPTCSRRLRKARAENGRQALQTALAMHLPKRLAQLDRRGRTPPAGNLADFSDKALRDVAQAVKDWRFKPAGSEGYRTAEVTLGGVDTRDLDSRTMAAREVPGLYFIGEVVDVTGWLGGYNFQWAWSSGWCAGQAV